MRTFNLLLLLDSFSVEIKISCPHLSSLKMMLTYIIIREPSHLFICLNVWYAELFLHLLLLSLCLILSLDRQVYYISASCSGGLNYYVFLRIYFSRLFDHAFISYMLYLIWLLFFRLRLFLLFRITECIRCVIMLINFCSNLKFCSTFICFIIIDDCKAWCLGW